MDCLIVPKVTLSFETRFANLKVIESLVLISFCTKTNQVGNTKIEAREKSRSKSHLPDCPHLNPKIPGVVAISYPRCCPKTWPPSGRRWDISLPKINKKEGSHHLCSSKNWDCCPAPISWAFTTRSRPAKRLISVVQPPPVYLFFSVIVVEGLIHFYSLLIPRILIFTFNYLVVQQ